MNSNNPNLTEHVVSVDQLRVGVFIRLKDVTWFDHPFFFSSFKISKPEQIQVMKSVGIRNVICVPEKSDVLPRQPQPKQAQVPKPPALSAEDQLQAQNLWRVKQERIKHAQQRREKAAKCEAHFNSSVETVKNVMQNIETAPQETFEEADVLMKSVVESLMSEKDLAVQLMNTKFGDGNVFYHSLNVAVVSMMFGKECGLDAESLRILGLGALFHDVGKNRIPRNIIRKKNLSSPERRLLQLHPKYGVDLLSKIEKFPKGALQIVYQHHERCDGQGYPLALAGDSISTLTKIVSIVNTYDNHCNKFDYQESLTPYESLAYMFSVQGEMFDTNFLSQFIHCLGVYPPGTIVQLSNGSIGMIVSVDPENPLQPDLMIYDSEIPRKEAIIFSMHEEPNLRIEGSVRPSALPQHVFDYLSPRTRITYYVDGPADLADKKSRAR